MADGEELRIKALVALINDVQMKKLEIKLTYLESLDKKLERNIEEVGVTLLFFDFMITFTWRLQT